MKVYCSYNEGYHNFLNKVVDSILDKYGSQLNISALEEIELVNKRKYKYITDGKAYNGKIEVTSRLYELLPTLEIGELENNNDYKLIRKTLYHEMGHINDMVLMPKLYGRVFQDFRNRNVNIHSMSILLWVEYIAEKRASGFENVDDMEVCEDFITTDWQCSKFEPYFSDDNKNFYNLTKLMPYFLSRTMDRHIRGKYLWRIDNNLLKEYIIEIDKELNFLETRGAFDDLIILNGLYEIIDKYYKKFMNEYER